MAEGGLYYDAEAREMARRDRDMIPKRLLVAMGALAMLGLSIATYASLTDRPLSGVPKPAPVVDELIFSLETDGQAIRLVRPDGSVLVDRENGAFIAVVGDGLERKRLVSKVEGNPPVALRRLENGRLVLSDPATGWTTELTSFGAGNARHWAELFDLEGG
ncbi:photosynthetic complex assembly protein [Palleronia sediminis]|uniref:Photosynthetic complex assembly protein n=1 Tax=Palleronia sediminis TaxID=2547833 RepID=A0A4R6A657_9RHOB|nr:photosynthetic complex assembly protein PuhC [Palleronia sediminis]TDL78232.1 photosynthetic complex assembly protein [Palleronia sediminis]